MASSPERHIDKSKLDSLHVGHENGKPKEGGYTPPGSRRGSERSMDYRRGSKTLDYTKEGLNENSPLIAPTGRREETDPISPISPIPSPDNHDEWTDDTSQETKSSWYLFLLTLAIGGYVEERLNISIWY